MKEIFPIKKFILKDKSEFFFQILYNTNKGNFINWVTGCNDYPFEIIVTIENNVYKKIHYDQQYSLNLLSVMNLGSNREELYKFLKRTNFYRVK